MSLPWVAVVHVTGLMAGFLVLRALGHRGSEASRGARLPCTARADSTGLPPRSRTSGGGAADLVGSLARALLLGPAALAVQMLAYDALGVPLSLPAVLAPWWVAALVAWRPRPLPQVARGETVVLVVATFLFVLLLREALLVPVFRGDAMLNFALNARVFATHQGLAPEALRALVDPGHIEYPPLIALNEALILLAAGDGGAHAIKALFPCAWLAFVLLASEAAFRALRPPAATMCALLVMLVPQLAYYATDGGADLRLAASVLALLLEGRALRAGERGAALRFAVFAGVCALTKNEGLPLAGAAFALLAGWTAWGGAGARRSGLAALGTLVVLAGWWPLLRRVHDIGDPWLAGVLAQDRIVHLDRLPALLEFVLVRLPGQRDLDGWPGWGLFWPICVLLGLVALARRRPPRAALSLALGFAAHTALYGTVFLVTPLRFDFHLGTAGYRLMVHTAPWLVLLLGVGLELVGRGTVEASAGEADTRS